ncbi:hypothetical protein IGS67_08675 [Flavimobilis sp. GY10621]|uniref:Competence protein CoiA nuclease-like domain-containing protein n=1 Tax=Flavimobilis rhizosphaerae TaxID=2775421 RepID=A0ABR9DR09_9MICO|nr:hypothetical protein [Flavimobilis rhizosphaerae]MBD9699561.1 hypothetical protein [Flavimobilis rhizosphaerae]
MHAKESVHGTRFFAHNVRPDSCNWGGESAEHRRLKAWLADVVRRAGGTAVVEARPADDDVRRWRADVLATSRGGRRFALEVQLSALTLAEVRERTERYAADGITTVWVTTRGERWGLQVPALELTLLSGTTVRRGAARWQGGRLVPAEGVPVEALIAGLVTGAVDVVGPVHCLGRDRDAIERSIAASGHGQYVLVDARYADDIAKFDAELTATVQAAQKEAQEERLRQRAARDSARAAAAARRAQAAARIAVENALRTSRSRKTARVTMDDPDRLLAAGLVVPRLENYLRTGGYERFGYSVSADASGVSEALPQRLGPWPEGGDGLAVWAAKAGDTLRIVGIVSPDARRVVPRHAERWAAAGWHVYVSCGAEANAVADAAGSRFAKRFLHSFDFPPGSLQAEAGQRRG